jgi:hypothetical protein
VYLRWGRRVRPLATMAVTSRCPDSRSAYPDDDSKGSEPVVVTASGPRSVSPKNMQRTISTSAH